MPQYRTTELPVEALKFYKAYRVKQEEASHYQAGANVLRAQFEEIMTQAALNNGNIIRNKTMLQFHYGFKEIVINVVPYEPKKTKVEKRPIAKLTW